MKRPWQAWVAYLIGLAVVVPAMAWLSWQVLAVDRAELLARRQAEREEQISRALWRMDARLTPLLAQEAARPEFFYEPIFCEPAKPGGKGAKEQPTRKSVSPLLREPPEYVLLHFRMTLDCCIDSPQCPLVEDRKWVCEQGVSEGQLTEFSSRRAELRAALKPEELLAALPTESWPVSRWDRPATGTRFGDQRLELPQVVSSLPAETLGNAYQNDIVENSNEANNPQQQQAAGNPPANQTSRRVTPPRSQTDNNPTNYNGRGNNPSLVTGQQQNFDNSVFTASRNPRNPDSANDLQARNSNFQAYAQQAVINQKIMSKYNEEINLPTSGLATEMIEGAFRPVWMGEQLLFARKVRQGEKILIQGCWLNWTMLQAILRENVADILPEFEFVALKNLQDVVPTHVLATLPVQIEVPPLVVPAGDWSPVRVALFVAWGGLITAAIAAAMTLQGIIALSERRAAFVAAVTHELRTPLTTFRMYAEMLAEEMVPDREQQQKYLTTLRTEADRLTHLVDNVLQYARLERSRPGKQRQTVTMAGLCERIVPRLNDRVAQVGMELLLAGTEEEAELEFVTDPAAIDQILFNLVDNASKYAAAAEDRRLHLTWQREGKQLAIRVIDHGPGIPLSGRRKLFSPFSKSVNEAAESAPGVGLGLALSQRLAHALGGRLEWEETAGGGATFCLRLPLS